MLFLVLLVEMLYLAPVINRNDVESAESHQSVLAGQIAASFDYSFRQAINEIETIARMPDIVSMDKKRIDRVLRLLNGVPGFFNFYFVLDANGQWVSHPALPELEGKTIPEANMGWVRRTFEEDRTVFMDMVKSRVGTLVTGFSTPIRSEEGKAVGLFRGVIVTTDENSILSTISGTRFGNNGYAYVVSENGWLIAHSGLDLKVSDFDAYDYSGHEPVKKCMNGEHGFLEYEYEGQKWGAAYRPVEATGWCVVVQQPMGDITEHTWKELKTYALMYMFSFVVGAFVLWAIIDYSFRPLGRLIEGLRTRKLPEELSFAKDEVGQICREFHGLFKSLSDSEAELRRHRDHLEDIVKERTMLLSESNERLEKEISERKRAEETIRASLEEKTLLIREIHHRVKNNTQIVSSLLSLQAGYAKTGYCADMFRESQNRIKSMSLIQEMIFDAKDLGNIDMEDYIRTLAKTLYRSYSVDANRVALDVEVGGIPISLDTAIPLGMVINELLSNCLRHAFPGDRKGRVGISISQIGEQVLELVVRDDGVGVSGELDPRGVETLGLQLVDMTVENQLHGSVKILTGNGTVVKVGFKEIHYPKRI